MWFAIWAVDQADKLDLRLAHRQEHRLRLQQLMDQGRVFCAGPLSDEDVLSGSLMVLDFPDFASAENWANQDPYYIHGLYQRLEIKPWQPVFTSNIGI